MRVSILFSLVALVSGCATPQDMEMAASKEASEQTRLAKTLAGYTAGEPRSCVDARDLRGPQSFGKATLLFQASPKLYYLNQTNGSCDGVGKGDALVTRQFSSQMCRGDIARSADLVAGFQTGACALGEFVPYRRN
jgi:hypothetical protein